MSYVDLNPIRAGVAEFPENSDYTSIQQRINRLSEKDNQKEVAKKKTASAKSEKATSRTKQVRLMPLTNNDKNINALGFTTRDYLELVDWAGRDHKRGSIPESAPSILDRLELDSDAFLEHIIFSLLAVAFQFSQKFRIINLIRSKSMVYFISEVIMNILVFFGTSFRDEN